MAAVSVSKIEFLVVQSDILEVTRSIVGLKKEESEAVVVWDVSPDIKYHTV